MVHFLVIRFEVALNVDDEGGCDRGEQMSLFHSDQRETHPKVEGMRKNTHKDQCGVQVLAVSLDNGAIIVVGCALEFGVKLGAGVPCSREVWKGSLQCSKHRALITEDEIKKRGEKGRETEEGKLTHAFKSIVASHITGYKEPWCAFVRLWKMKRVEPKQKEDKDSVQC